MPVPEAQGPAGLWLGPRGRSTGPPHRMLPRFEVSKAPRSITPSVTSRGRNTEGRGRPVHTAADGPLAPRQGPQDRRKAEGWAFPGPPLRHLAQPAARPCVTWGEGGGEREQSDGKHLPVLCASWLARTQGAGSRPASEGPSRWGQSSAQGGSSQWASSPGRAEPQGQDPPFLRTSRPWAPGSTCTWPSLVRQLPGWVWPPRVSGEHKGFSKWSRQPRAPPPLAPSQGRWPLCSQPQAGAPPPRQAGKGWGGCWMSHPRPGSRGRGGPRTHEKPQPCRRSGELYPCPPSAPYRQRHKTVENQLEVQRLCP